MIRPLLPLAAAAALAAATVFPAAAQAPQTPRIVVTGAGEATLAPDMALLSLAVMREAKTAREALDANSEAMRAVIAAMKEAGIEARDLQTAGLQINPRYDYPQRDGVQTAVLAAYQVTNTLSVRVRDLAMVGEVIDRAVTLGVNQGGGVSFTNEDPAEARTEARRRAVADALDKARTLAEAGGVELGRILEMSEQAHSAPPQPFLQARTMEAKDAAVPVEAGENAYRVEVNVTFELR